MAYAGQLDAAPLDPSALVNRLVLLGIILELGVSANLLTWCGLPYVSEGGNLLAKIHPATYAFGMAFVLLVVQPSGWAVLMTDWRLAVFLGGMAASLIYLLVLTGTGSTIVLLDTFLPAGMLAVILSQIGDDQQRHRLRHTMQIMLAVGAMLALAEAAMQSTLIPLYLNEAVYHPHQEEFRPTALYDHPLTGALMTMLGLALCPARGVVRLSFLALMWAALVAYGGRMALAASLSITIVAWGANASKLLIQRDLRATHTLVAAVAALVIAASCIGLALAFGLGTRIVGHLYWDDSAQVRLAQWRILDQLDVWQLLFGTPRDELLALLNPLRLATGVEVIENFWLLMFLGLGVFGFPLFVGSFLSLLVWCWRRSELQGRLLLLAVTAVASTSNSLGRKSTVLVCLIATVASLPPRRLGQVRRSIGARSLPAHEATA